MRPVMALPVAALLSLGALAGTAAAASFEVPDSRPVTDPAHAGGDQAEALLFAFVYSFADTAASAGVLFQERFDHARGIAEDLAAEGGVAVNRCPIGSALPAVRLPRGSDQVLVEPGAWVALANAWGDDLAGPVNGEADCRAYQAWRLGAPALDPPDVPRVPALPDAPAPPAGSPAVPPLGIPDLALPG